MKRTGTSGAEKRSFGQGRRAGATTRFSARKGAPSVESPLNAKKIEPFCAQYTSKQTIDSIDDWIRCQRRAAEAAASSKMAASSPTRRRSPTSP